MSIKIAKLKNYIKETYERIEGVNHSNDWNLGYINALMDKGIISRIEAGNLITHNDKIYLVEDMKIMNRKNSIEKEEAKIRERINECIRRINGKEKRKMELEEIKKRIDRDIKLLINRHYCIDSPEEMNRVLDKTIKALEIYKELIMGIDEMDNNKNALYRINLFIQELEDKYYPKPKNTRDKFNDIIRKVIKYELNTDMGAKACEDINESLAELREEIEEGGNQ